MSESPEITQTLQRPARTVVPVSGEHVGSPLVARPIGRRTLDDRASLVGSLLAALAITWLVYERMLAFGGYVGFAVCWWLTFIIVYTFVSASSHPWVEVKDRLAGVIVASGASIIALVLGCMVVFVFLKGWPALHHWNFYTQDMTGVSPLDPLSKGGISHALVGSAIEVGIAVLVALPLGIGTAVYMSEVGGRAAKLVRTVVEAMTALPDILAGLFVYTVLIVGLHWDRTGLSAALALVVTMVPIVARSAEVTLRVVPGGLREASWALGASQWQTVWRVVLPTARSGLTTALILGIARVSGETAPLLIVSGSSTYFNANPLSQPMNSLPLFIYGNVRGVQDENILARGYGAAAVLLTVVLILFTLARFVARPRSGSR